MCQTCSYFGWAIFEVSKEKCNAKRKVKGALNSIELTNNSITVNLKLNGGKYCKTFFSR